MNCETARRMMETNDPGLARHVATCPSCVVRANARYYEAPAGLEQKIRRQVRGEIAEKPLWRWVAIAAGVLLMASLGWNIAMLRSRVDLRERAESEVLSAHIRSLAGTHLLDVPSSDQHTVKPWFNGKLDFAPQVKEVEGYSLLGGRLEYFDGRGAAALVYGRRNHVINVFTWPGVGAEVRRTWNGYHLEGWSAGGMRFWVVSDLNEAELRGFVDRFRE